MKYLQIAFTMLLMVLVVTACGPAQGQTQTAESDNAVSGDAGSDDLEKSLIGDVKVDTKSVDQLLSKLSATDFKLPERTIKKPVYSMPASYLQDALVFKSLDYSTWEGKRIAVVGKRNVFLYQDIIAGGSPDFSGLDNKKIIEVPIGTIVPLEKKYKNKGGEYSDLYTFHDYMNYWFKTTYKGKTGIIFGAYLAGLDYSAEPKNAEGNVRTSYYYTKPEKETVFYDHVGKRRLSEQIKTCLAADKLAFEKVKQNEYYLSIDYPDDLIALYRGLAGDKTSTIFITSDMLMHCLHLLFDRMLEYVEQEKFLPILTLLVDDYLRELDALKSNTAASSTVMLASIDTMKHYFQVAQALLKVAGAAQQIKNKDDTQPWEDQKKPDVNIDAINASYPDIVKSELSLIYKAKGFAVSPLFKYKEDYTQFKPRGHYTRSVELEAYFRAMMWFGRIHMYIDPGKTPVKGDGTRFEKSIEHVPYILILTKISKENKDIFNKWVSLFKPINYVVGEPDDLSFYDIYTVLDKVDMENLGPWLQKKQNIIDFITQASSQLRSALIQGNTDESTIGDKTMGPPPPVGFRFFGQRFTIDSFIHNQLSGRRVGKGPGDARNMVKGLDIMAVFGNRAALSLLKKDIDTIWNFKEQLAKMKTLIRGFDNTSWRKTFYNGYLKLVQEITTFQKGSGFYFTQSSKWDKKALLTSHASWAELRHDTILYVKQSYAERAGGGGDEPMYNLDPIPEPINYVEPNLGFFYWLQVLLEDSRDILGKTGFMDDNFKTKFADFNEIVDQLTVIVELEVADKPISKLQNEFIRGIPAKLARIILPPKATFGGSGDADTFRMALVADVHTDALDGVVLEVATGIPYRVYVALDDGQGGKRIAVGYTYSYYEFPQPMDNRLNDDQWKKIVYTQTDTLDNYLPPWAKDIICR